LITGVNNYGITAIPEKVAVLKELYESVNVIMGNHELIVKQRLPRTTKGGTAILVLEAGCRG